MGVSASLASSHLRKLVDGLIVVEPAGRHRLFRLANAVADALEGLLLLAPEASVRSLAVRSTHATCAAPGCVTTTSPGAWAVGVPGRLAP